MNPQFDQTPGLHLPQPNTAGQQPTYSQAVAGTPQSPLAAVGFGPAPTQPGFQLPIVANAAQQAIQPAVAPPPSASATFDDGDTVGDSEWVTKARDISMRYKGDPFMQTRELSKLKAQYVKARYSKDIKLSEDR